MPYLGLGLFIGDSLNPSSSVPFANALSCEFDGSNDFISCGSTGDTYYDIGTNDFSFSFWLYLDSGPSGAYGPVFGISPTSNGYQAYLTSARKFVFFNHPNLTGDLSAALSTSQWHHVAFVRNSGSLTVYVNGTAGTSRSVGSLTFIHTTDFRIGNDSNNSFGPIDGAIDEFAIWKNYALTTTQISNIRGGVSAGTLGAPADISSIGTDASGSSGPDNWWRMGDGTGDTNSSGGTPSNGESIGTIVDQGSAGKNGTQSTASSKPTFSNSVPS